MGARSFLYAWCAPDALLLPGLVSQHAQVVSPCRATGQDVTFVLEAGNVAEVRPSGAVLSFMAVIDPGNIRGAAFRRLHGSLDIASSAPYW